MILPNPSRTDNFLRYLREQAPANPTEADLVRLFWADPSIGINPSQDAQDFRQLFPHLAPPLPPTPGNKRRRPLPRAAKRLRALVYRAVERKLARELPEAVEYLVKCELGQSNGQSARRVS